jgi:putative NADH-flavin reductase
MKVAVIGSTGFVGSKLIVELVNRKFQVLGISNSTKNSSSFSNLTYINLDVNNTAELASQIEGYDVLISAFSAGWNNPNYHEDFINCSVSIQNAALLAGVSRYIVIGGSGSLYVSADLQAVDTDTFPEEFKTVARAAKEYLNHLKTEETLEWLYVSPPFEMHPGIINGRTGNYRFGTLNPIFDNNGKSSISVEDLAVAIVDEVESNKFSKTIYTVAY